MKTKTQKRHIGDLVGHILTVITLIGVVTLGYWSLKSDNQSKFESIERLRGETHNTTAAQA